MMLARENAVASHPVEEGIRIATRDKHAFALNAPCVSLLDSDTVSRVLARQAKSARQASGPNLLQTDEADANQRVSTMELVGLKAYFFPLLTCTWRIADQAAIGR
jgi:hypothetical protein